MQTCPGAAQKLRTLADEASLLLAAIEDTGVARVVLKTPYGSLIAPAYDSTDDTVDRLALVTETGEASGWRDPQADGEPAITWFQGGDGIVVEADFPVSWFWRFTLPVEGAVGEVMVVSRGGDVLARGDTAFGMNGIAPLSDVFDGVGPNVGSADGRVVDEGGVRVAAASLGDGGLRLVHVARSRDYVWHTVAANAGLLVAFLALGAGALAGYIAVRVFVLGPARRAELALERLSMRLQAIFTTANDGICLADADGFLLAANEHLTSLIEAPALNVAEKPALGEILSRAAHPEAAFTLSFADLVAAGANGVLLRTRAGRSLLIRSARVEGSDQHVVTVTDMTDRVRMELELEAARDAAEAAARSKAAFLAVMSHEIRTPMNGVIGMVELLSQTKLDPEQRRSLRTVRESGFTLLRIINDILDFSKIEAGRLDIEALSFDLTSAVEDAAANLGAAASTNGVRLLTFVDPALPRLVVGDPVRLRQILVNLIGNAVKFSRNADVVVRAAPASGETGAICFSVLDHGIGISAENQKKLFQEFSQAEATTTRRFGGTGLGLAICKRLVEMMGGRIGVTSEPGQGADFRFTLPLPASEDALWAEGTGAALADLDVLVLGDNRQERGFCRGYLEASGARVREASYGTVSLELRADAAVLLPGATSDLLARLCAAGVPLVIARDPLAAAAVPTDIPGVRIAAQPLARASLIGAVAEVSGRAAPGLAPEAESACAAAPAPQTVEEAEARGRLVLVAEDNVVNQEVIAGQLARLGYACELVDDGAAAFEAFRSGRFALLLTDCHMPTMDGFELTTQIRAHEASSGGKSMPIIAVTASVLGGEAERCREVGMDVCLAKPVELAQLRAALQHWLPEAPAAEIEASRPAQSSKESGDRLDLSHLEEAFGGDRHRIARVLKRFLESAPVIVADAERAAATRDAGSSFHAGHKLKTSARMIGALALAEVSEALEAAGEAEDPDLIGRLTIETRAQLEKTRTLIDALAYPLSSDAAGSLGGQESRT